MGAEAVHELLERIDLDELELFIASMLLPTETSQQRKADALKRLSVVEVSVMPIQESKPS
jgi:DNA-directed RNA polymerase subunit beta'